MVSQEALEAVIVVDSPIVAFDATVVRRHPQNTLISDQLGLGRARVHSREVNESATVDCNLVGGRHGANTEDCKKQP